MAMGIECKDILLNISLAILGVGILYLTACAANYYVTDGKYFFFKTQTESEKIINNLSSTVSTMDNSYDFSSYIA